MSRIKTYFRASGALFLSGSLTTVLAAGALAYLERGRLWPAGLAACLGGVGCLHLGASLMNGYFDAAEANPAPSSGGSGAIRDGLPGRRAALVMALVFLGLAAALGLIVTLNGRPWAALWGLLGLTAAVLYSARPIRLKSRGLGEAAVFLAFGPLLTLGAGYALGGEMTPQAASLGLPPGLLIMAATWLDRFPNPAAESPDGQGSPNPRPGLGLSGWICALLLLGAFAWLPVLAFVNELGWLLMAGLAPLPLVLAACLSLRRNRRAQARARTVQAHALLTLILAAALVGERFLRT